MTEPWDYLQADWVEAGYPMTGPAFDWAAIRFITIHYPGAPRVLGLSVDSERAEIRAENRMYWTDPNRGYALGYNAKVFQDGSKWELRGDRLRCAANGNQQVNVPAFAIQIRVANDETPSDLLIASVRELVAWCRRMAGRDLPINGHRDLKPTGCPGDKAYHLIQSGAFEPSLPNVIDPPAPIPPTSEEDDMTMLKRYRDRRFHNVWLIPHKLHLSGEADAAYAADGVPLIEGQHEQMLDDLLHASGLTRAALVKR